MKRYKGIGMLRVNKTKEIRARFAARDMVDGSFLGDYTRIYDYCYEIFRTNHWSTIKLNVQLVQEGIDDRRPHLRRLYICYATCKESLKLCRHVIGLDGYFLKVFVEGKLWNPLVEIQMIR